MSSRLVVGIALVLFFIILANIFAFSFIYVPKFNKDYYSEDKTLIRNTSSNKTLSSDSTQTLSPSNKSADTNLTNSTSSSPATPSIDPTYNQRVTRAS